MIEKNSSIDRRLPFSLEAEQSLIGSIIIDPACLDEVTQLVGADDFHLPEHREIYKAMLKMYATSRNIDTVTLIQQLVESGTYTEAGGNEYLMLVASAVPTALHAAEYAKIVREKAVLRELIQVSEEIAEAAYSEEAPAQNLVERAESAIYGISGSHTQNGFTPLSEALISVYERLQMLQTDPDKVNGSKTGFGELDKLIVGICDSDLVLVGARPGMGKTAFAMNLAVEFAKRSHKSIAVFSLEMTAEQLAERMLCAEALVDSYKMRSGNFGSAAEQAEAWTAIAHASGELAGTDMLIADDSAATIAGMRSKLRRVKNLGLVVVDYLQLMQGDHHNENRVQEVGEISRGLKLLAKEFHVPIICCAQLNRAVESRQDKRPNLSDLRDSGAIEQDADIVLMLYREDYYGGGMSDSTAEVIVAKNRHGALGTAKVGWIPQYLKFVNMGG